MKVNDPGCYQMHAYADGQKLVCMACGQSINSSLDAKARYSVFLWDYYDESFQTDRANSGSR